MTGNLAIDMGNTSVKVAFFMGDKLVASSRFAQDDTRLLDRFISTYKPEGAIISSTAHALATRPIEALVERRCPRLLRLSHDTPLPIGISYDTPSTLGRDRIATSVGAWAIASRENGPCDLLVIDAGTAVTYDLVAKDGSFAGGNIAPGLSLRFRSLHEHTGRLPLIDPMGETPLMGHDTVTAIRSGVVLGLLGEVRACIAALRLNHPTLRVFLTGGDGKWLHEQLADDSITFHEHLAAEGLNRIYLYQLTNETC